jgi:hypothetical protein
VVPTMTDTLSKVAATRQEVGRGPSHGALPSGLPSKLPSFRRASRANRASWVKWWVTITTNVT